MKIEKIFKNLFKKTRKKQINKKKSRKKEVVEVTLKGWRTRVREKDLIRIIKREYKNGTKKVVALDEIDWQVNATYDVNKLMKKINNNETENILKKYDRFFNVF